jgi:hypothetical protein
MYIPQLPEKVKADPLGFLGCLGCRHARKTPEGGIVCGHADGPRPGINGCGNFQDKKIQKRTEVTG